MNDNLIIVESPTKANTIQKLLGDNYNVVSTYGHIIDLPEKDIGIEIKKNFHPNYVILPKKKRIIKTLKELIKKYKIIWLALDEDREGESIAYQIYKTFKISDKKYKRIIFHEITKKSILDAIKNPRKIDYNLVLAQQARRIVDRLVGFKLSPILWKKIRSGLSAGRVQSVAVRLIVEREKKIEKSTSNYYKINGIFFKENIIINASLNKKIKDEKDVKNILLSCINTKKFVIKKILKDKEIKNPPVPFTTSSLQQNSYNSLNFSTSKTMFIAQKLYEKGYITYIRTDSRKLSDFIISDIKYFVLEKFGKEYLFIKKLYKKQKFSQGAHEAIRPTTINNDSLKNENYLKLDNNEKKLYKLIFNRTIMSQMTPASFKKKTFCIEYINSKNYFCYVEKKIVFHGFMKILENKKLDTKTTSQKFKVGTFLYKDKIIAKQIFRKKLNRYNEATLVKNMENIGIGRPSTYSPIISTIQKRNYVFIQKKLKKINNRKIFSIKKDKIIENNETFINTEKNQFLPTEIGILVTNFIKKYFKEIIDYLFTAHLEKKFDEIANGKTIWIKVIENFYKNFEDKIKYVYKNVDKICKERFLGIYNKSETEKKIYSRIARFGSVIQIGDFDDNDKPIYLPILNTQKFDKISLNEALKIIELPKVLGILNNKEIILNINKYNVYIKYDKKYIPIEKKFLFSNTLNLQQAIYIIENSK